jgi:hypothetical protein
MWWILCCNRSVRFAEYIIGHATRLLDDELIVDIDDSTVLQYQSNRLSAHTTFIDGNSGKYQ